MRWPARQLCKKGFAFANPLSIYRKDRSRSYGGILYSATTVRPCPFAQPVRDQLVGLRASFASMHSVAWGTFISRSLGISFPVVLQIP